MIKTKFCLSLLTLTSLSVSPQTAISQTYQPSNRTPVSDNTLGTQVSGNGNNFNITGGLTKGQTLFHSFTDFSVPTNGAANFVNLTNPRDIITRVTGNSFSDINGLVNTNGANFFLINPNGIVFGTNAQLNVGRAFMASTANGINLADGAGNPITFGTNTNGDPLLKIAPNVLFNVSSLTMGGGNGQISNFGTLQTNNLGQYIGLIGGNVSLNGGIINAPGGRVELGGLSAPGTVTFGVQGDAQLPTNVARGDVSLTNGARVDVTGAGGGDISITSRNLEILGGSSVRGGIGAGLGSLATVAGDIKVNATGDVKLADISAIGNIVNTGAVGKGGAVEIDARNISLDGNGNGFRSGIFNAVDPNGIGAGGRIDITTGNLSVTNGAGLVASTLGQGDAGSLKITATGNILLDGFSNGLNTGVFSTVEQGAEGKGGGIEITTGNLSATNGAILNATTFGKGDAGSIKVTATGNISFDSLVNGFPSGAFSTVEQGGQGKGGSVEISAQNLLVTNGAEVGAFTRGQGSAGSVKITAKGHVSLDGKKDGVNSGVFSTVEKGGIGKGGGIEITADNLSVTNFATVTTSSKGQGDGGDIFLNANKIVLNNPNTAVVDINNGGIISISLSSTGGDIKVVAKDYLLLRNNSLIATNSFSTGKDGNGGNITISSPLIVATPGNNDITANAVQGNGGNLKISSQSLFSIQFRAKGQNSPFTNDITASSTFGRDGNVNIDTPGTDPGRDSTELPNTTTDASNQISQVCSANNRQNKLTVTGRGGLPPNANDPLTSDVVWQDARAASFQPAVSSVPTPAKLAPPAVGWVFDGKGKVTLIAAGTEGQPTGTRVVCPK